jgi:hypothetical protein
MEPRNTTMEMAFAFVCEPGELEIKSALLAYSLRKFYPSSIPVYALIPKYKNRTISIFVAKVFDSLAITTSFFDNPITEGKLELLPGLPMSNKFFGLKNLKIMNGSTVFLDSDVVCLNTLEKEILNHSLSAKPADFRLPADWHKIYEISGLTVPLEEIVTTVDGKSGPPYYNTGLIVFENSVKDDLCDSWNYFFKLFTTDKISTTRLFNPYHSDQLAFALAIQNLKLQVNCLTEMYNFPARRRTELTDEVIFAHYHDCQTIAKHKKLNDIFWGFVQTYPEIIPVLQKYRYWGYLLEKKFILMKAFDQFKRIKRLYYKGIGLVQ